MQGPSSCDRASCEDFVSDPTLVAVERRVAAEAGPNPVGNVGLGPRVGGDADVAQDADDELLLAAHDGDLGGDRGGAEAPHERVELELIIEACGSAELEACLCDDRVDTALDHLLPRPDRSA